MQRRNLRSALAAYADRYPQEQGTVQRFATLLGDHTNCFERTCWAGHITGSAWIVDPTRQQTLLTHHAKLNIWVQTGGHSDGDPDTWAVAQREGEEESGLRLTLLDAGIFDLDVHEIPARKADPAHWHYDVRFAFLADSAAFKVSEESHALAWVPIADLGSVTQEESMLRMARKWQQQAAD